MVGEPGSSPRSTHAHARVTRAKADVSPREALDQLVRGSERLARAPRPELGVRAHPERLPEALVSRGREQIQVGEQLAGAVVQSEVDRRFGGDVGDEEALPFQLLHPERLGLVEGTAVPTAVHGEPGSSRPKPALPAPEPELASPLDVLPREPTRTRGGSFVEERADG